jgi:hypothetical protein
MVVCLPLARPLIFIEFANRLLSRRPISTLIRLGSNILRALIRIVMIASLAHHQHLPPALPSLMF